MAVLALVPVLAVALPAAPCFFTVEVEMDGAPLAVDRAPHFGVERPNVRYQMGEGPPGPTPRIALSPLVYGEHVEGAAMHPDRHGAGEIVFKLGLRCPSAPALIEQRWRQKFGAADAMAPPVPIARPPLRGAARVALLTSADIGLLVEAEELFRDKIDEGSAARRPRPSKRLRFATVRDGGTVRLVHKLAAGEPVPLYLLGDGLRVELAPY
jgi:hypothetical protein